MLNFLYRLEEKGWVLSLIHICNQINHASANDLGLQSEHVRPLDTEHILHLNPDAVLCQGECTFVYRVVQRLEAAGIPTLARCV